jgi:hypothetical protein
MHPNPSNLFAKIGILILIIAIGGSGCNRRQEADPVPVTRFEKLMFTIPPSEIADSIRLNHKELLPFFTLFNQGIIGIGPDSLPGYEKQLEEFVGDQLLGQVFSEVERSAGAYLDICREVDRALDRWAEKTGGQSPDHLVTYISGFNQSFITLPGILGIGVDNYLGRESSFYQGLGIPAYIRKSMDPEHLAADAVRAWLYSEIPEPSVEGGFLDRMIYEGIIYYIASALMPRIDEGNLFHYSEEQLTWCRDQEQSMWKYLAEQKILFSTDRMTIRKFMDEAPFTRDFGNESPGRTGVWIGYRVVSSYMKATRKDIRNLSENINPKEILSGSRYHP